MVKKIEAHIASIASVLVALVATFHPGFTLPSNILPVIEM
jgi:hypothetical protein